MGSRQRFPNASNPSSRPHSFRRDWKSSHVDRTYIQNQRPLLNGTPFAASTTSKTKLVAFMYKEDYTVASKMEEHDKENRASDKEEATTILMNPPPQPSSQRSASKEVRDCPQTPVGRLPLSELLANSDDPRHHQNVTPIERVLWDNSPLGSATLSSISKGKKRKRARSSSPISSQKQPSKHFALGQTPRNTSALDKALETPKADLVDDLWSRYSLDKSDRRSPTAQFNAHFPQLLHSSSPNAEAPSRESTGLRRAFSCIDWPTSAIKRRKMMHHSSSQIGDGLEFGALEKPVDSLKKTKSRVSLLVERIHSDLAKPKEIANASSSDPVSLPSASNANSPAKKASLDPQSQAQVDQVAITLSQADVNDSLPSKIPLVHQAGEGENLDEAGASSDFDDEDFDIGMMEALSGAVNTKTNPCPEKQHSRNSPRQALRPACKGKEDSEGARLHKGKSASPTKLRYSYEKIRQPPGIVDLVDDEFGDDEEVVAAELEGILAGYDTQHFPRQVLERENIAKEKDMSRRASNGDSAFGPLNKPDRMSEVISEEEDFFDGDSDFEQIAVEVSTSQIREKDFHTQTSSDRRPSFLERFIIKAIAESEYETSTGQIQVEKVLSVQSEKGKLNKVINLRQAWLDTPCSVGFYLHLVGDFDRYGQCTVDNSQNLLILHPDHLISATVVGDSFTCTRKAILGDRVKATTDGNQATLYGHMIHEIFQEAMKANRWDDEWMVSAIEKIATRHLEGLFELNIELPTALDQLRARIRDLQVWAGIFVAAEPNPHAVIKNRDGSSSNLCVNKLLEVEEKVWSPVFGLKGNIDATVQVKIQNGEDEATLTVPFELKTGKHSSAAHKAQTSLYTLLLSDRYDLNIACGILYYMQNSEISTIRTLRHELVPMVIQRNRLAEHIRKRELPPMLKNAHTCGKCFAQSPCFIYHKMIDDGNGETSGVGESFETLTRHLKPAHQVFFNKWDSLLTKEEKDIVLLRRELWTMEGSEREKTGRCFGGLVIDPGSFHEETEAPKINRFTYRFIKQRRAPTFSFTDSHFVLGEPIVVSDEKGHFALANGYVTGVRKFSIEVTIDRRLHNARAKEKSFDAAKNQSFRGIMKVSDEIIEQYSSNLPEPEEPVIYRLDKDEFSNGMAMVRNNLITLMEKDLFGVQALRKLIVEGVAPTFNAVPSSYKLIGTASQANLNSDQIAAIEKVMSAKDYALVLGMPGTGKTTTIAYIIRALVAQGKNVLLTSYTHTAVDNILLKLRKDKIGIFRVGAVAKIHAEIQEFADISSKPMKTVEDIKRCYSQQVVATTCLGINHPIFNQRIFDYCIVDEASQITLPVCLGPIRMSRAFILVGDHYQLPPLVQNKEALEGGLDVSLFKMLSDAHPSSVTNLEHQYRMCSDIMTLSNTLIYNGRLKCGTQEVATRSITIPEMSALTKHHHTPNSAASTTLTHICPKPTQGTCWLRDLLDPTLKACFINTDPLTPSSRELLESGSRITNPAEATLTTHLVEALLTTGVPAKDIGVITLYRSQLASIKTLLRHRPAVEMHTADRFQGRDKDAIVLSLVRSNENQIVGDLLKDWRRVNVALTRARTKLLILGSRSTLVGNDLLRDLIALLVRNGGFYDLPARALEDHLFEDGATQFSTAKGSVVEEDGAVVAAKVMEERERRERVEEDRRRGVEKEKRFGKRKPGKQVTLDAGRLLERRPVLRDIVNDAS